MQGKRISGYSPGWWPDQSRCNWIWASAL